MSVFYISKMTGFEPEKAGDSENTAELAIFGTYGLYPTEKYLNKINKTVTVWIDESVEYPEMHICQGKAAKLTQRMLLDNCCYNRPFDDQTQERQDEHDIELDEVEKLQRNK